MISSRLFQNPKIDHNYQPIPDQHSQYKTLRQPIMPISIKDFFAYANLVPNSNQISYINQISCEASPYVCFWPNAPQTGRTTAAIMMCLSFMTRKPGCKVTFSVRSEQDMIQVLRSASSVGEKAKCFRENSLIARSMAFWNGSSLDISIVGSDNFRTGHLGINSLHVIDRPFKPIIDESRPSRIAPWIGISDTLIIE